MRKLASAIASMEGKGVQVSIGNIREVLKCLSLLLAAEAVIGGDFYRKEIAGSVNRHGKKMLKVSKSKATKKTRKKAKRGAK